jgi:citrate lyase subunit beta/citryl-CoA lyase
MSDKPLRSWLVVPASNADAIACAATSGADVVVLDLVEFVSAERRAPAREKIRVAIEVARAGGAAVYVQTDPHNHEADLRACVGAGLSGILVARAESAAQIAALDALLSMLEKDRSLAPRSLSMALALETARGNQDAYDIASASPRVRALTLGRADLVMDLRPEPSGEIHLMPYLMQRLVIIARSLNVTPIGAWWRAPDRGLLATPQNTLAAARRGRAVGFKGAMCLRAEQIEPLNKIYA